MYMYIARCMCMCLRARTHAPMCAVYTTITCSYVHIRKTIHMDAYAYVYQCI